MRPINVANSNLHVMFVTDSRFFCCICIKGLKGNTGVKSGAVPATVIHNFVADILLPLFANRRMGRRQQK